MEEMFLEPLDYGHVIDVEWLPYIFVFAVWGWTYQTKPLTRHITAEMSISLFDEETDVWGGFVVFFCFSFAFNLL